MVVMLAAVGFGGWFALNKFVLDKGEAVTVQSDWKAVNSKLGFRVKVPPKWEVGSAENGEEFAGIKPRSVTVGPPIEVGVGSADSTAENDFSVSLDRYTQTGKRSKSAFETSVTDKKIYEQVYSLFGGKADDITLTQSTVKVGGKEWLRVDTSFNDISVTTLYYWVDDHAIGLSLVGLPDEKKTDTKENPAYQHYLLPMASSVEITD
jgi:hypothetical protein